MTISRNIFLHSMMAILVLSLTGCASFQGKQLQPVKQFPEVALKKSVDIDVVFTARLNGKYITTLNEWARKTWEKRCIKQMNKSKMFGEVSESLTNPDLVVKVSVVDEGEGSMGAAVATGLTLYIIPSSMTDTFHLRAKVIDLRSGKQCKIALTDSITQYQQILLLPLLPFKSTLYEANKCISKMYDNMCIEIYRAGLLE